MSLDILKDEIKNKKLRDVYLFYGQEEYLKKLYLNNIEKLVVSNEFSSLNKIVLEGKVDVSKIIDNCNTLPVFSDRKLVIVKNSGLFKGSKKGNTDQSKGKSTNEELALYIQQASNSTCLVFFEEEIDKRIKLVDSVKKNGLIVEFGYLKPQELVKWVITVVNSNKKEIDAMNASVIVEYCEQSMNDILNEINKLVIYLGENKKIERADIEKICTKSIKSKIFDLTDAVADKNTDKALKYLNDMIILKEPVQKILFMLIKQFRQVLQMKVFRGDGQSVEQATSKMGISPYAASKISRQATSFTFENLRQAINLCLEYDVAIKTGRINDRIATELLITEFSKR